MSATRQESWVALLEDGQLVEMMFDRPDQNRLVGDVFLGRVEAVLPGIQAAFVDIGTEKAGFLHVSDLDHDEDDLDDGNGDGRRPKRQKKFPPIQEHVQKGQEILVQVTKEAISTKGPRLTAQVSLPGRWLVFIPNSSHVGISRKIEGREQRGRLRRMAKEILRDGEGGIIVRTVSEEVTQQKLEQELERLRELWGKITSRSKSQKAPVAVHRDAKLVSGIMRDLFSDKFDALRVDSKEVFEEMTEYVRSVDPDLLGRIHLHNGSESLFDEHGVEEEIQKAFLRRVGLKSGGHVVIEQTEALVAIDVNTGRFTGKGKRDPEETILRTNLDAAREIAKQLRLRDIGGIIVADFIDMESQENRDKVIHELRTQLGRDRARTRAFEVSGLGLVEMTRQRVRPSLFDSLTSICPLCEGTGRLYTPETVVRRIERSLRRAGTAHQERRLVVRVHPEVALHILEEEPGLMRRLAKQTRLELDLRDDPLVGQDRFRLLAGPAETDVTQKYAIG